MGETANIGLHQWAGADQFLREDFNADFQKIDAAVGRAEGKADRALAGLVPVSYNVYNLMLRDYYEGRHTGFKKALVFDGFTDHALVASADAGLFWNESGRTWLLDATGQGDFDYNWGSDSQVRLDNSNGGVCTTGEFMPSGGGTVTAVTLTMKGAAGCTVTLLQDGAAVGSGYQKLADMNATRTYTFPMQAVIRPDLPCRLRVTSSNEDSAILVWGAANREPGFQAKSTPSHALSGVLTTVSFPLEGAGDRLLAWVRYTGGEVAMEARGGAGAYQPMGAPQVRQTENLQGEPCSEAAFALNHPPAGPLAFRLTLRAASRGDNVRLYDYGVVLI